MNGPLLRTDHRLLLSVAALLLVLPLSVLAAQEESAETASPAEDSKAPLAAEQDAIAEKYKRFESVLLRMAELTAAQDPRRAALLRQAVAQSRDREITTRFEALVKFLQDNRLALAVSNQGDLEKELARLMELLLSENREERLASEQARVREYLKRVNKLIKDQKSIQGQTSGKNSGQGLAEKQGKLADETGKLAKEIQEAEEGKPASSDGQSEDPPSDQQGEKGTPGQEQDNGKKPEQSPPDNAKPHDSGKSPEQPAAKPGEGSPKGDHGDQEKQQGENPSKPAKPNQGKPGQPGQEGEPGEPAEPPEQPASEEEENPARKRIAAAEERMKKAQQRLEEAKRKDAAEEQEEAIRELEQAKAELEKILRQMREEEMERMLAQLESRFRKMLVMQVEVYEGTLRLDKVPLARRGRNDEIEAGRLSRKESAVALEAEKALTLLREEGSAVAMPEAVSQMHEDMQQVVLRLAEAKVDELTQGIEEDIITALEEMIAALQQAQQDLEDQKSSPPGQPGGQQDQPLIDKIAELKMIRALQVRVNRRTQRYAELIEGREQAVEPDVLEALRELSEREERIYQSTRDIVTGRNQ